MAAATRSPRPPECTSRASRPWAVVLLVLLLLLLCVTPTASKPGFVPLVFETFHTVSTPEHVVVYANFIPLPTDGKSVHEPLQLRDYHCVFYQPGTWVGAADSEDSDASLQSEAPRHLDPEEAAALGSSRGQRQRQRELLLARHRQAVAAQESLIMVRTAASYVGLQVAYCKHPPPNTVLANATVAIEANGLVSRSRAGVGYVPIPRLRSRQVMALDRTLLRYTVKHPQTGTTGLLSSRRRGLKAAPKPSQLPHQLCACIMIWNRARFLREWVRYHMDLGLERVFVYDNDSPDNLGGTVAMMQAAGVEVERRYWPYPHSQRAYGSHCTLFAAESCEFLMFLDIDEFLFTAGNTMPTNPMVRLRRLPEHVGVLQMYSLAFRASGHIREPVGGPIRSYVCRDDATESTAGKVIVRPAVLGPYMDYTVHSFIALLPARRLVLTISSLLVHHYKFQAWDVTMLRHFRRAGPGTQINSLPREQPLDLDHPTQTFLDSVGSPDCSSPGHRLADTTLRDFVACRISFLETPLCRGPLGLYPQKGSSETAGAIFPFPLPSRTILNGHSPEDPPLSIATEVHPLMPNANAGAAGEEDEFASRFAAHVLVTGVAGVHNRLGRCAAFLGALQDTEHRESAKEGDSALGGPDAAGGDEYNPALADEPGAFDSPDAFDGLSQRHHNRRLLQLLEKEKQNRDRDYDREQELDSERRAQRDPEQDGDRERNLDPYQERDQGGNPEWEAAQADARAEQPAQPDPAQHLRIPEGAMVLADTQVHFAWDLAVRTHRVYPATRPDSLPTRRFTKVMHCVEHPLRAIADARDLPDAVFDFVGKHTLQRAQPVRQTLESQRHRSLREAMVYWVSWNRHIENIPGRRLLLENTTVAGLCEMVSGNGMWCSEKAQAVFGIDGISKPLGAMLQVSESPMGASGSAPLSWSALLEADAALAVEIMQMAVTYGYADARGPLEQFGPPPLRIDPS